MDDGCVFMIRKSPWTFFGGVAGGKKRGNFRRVVWYERAIGKDPLFADRDLLCVDRTIFQNCEPLYAQRDPLTMLYDTS